MPLTLDYLRQSGLERLNIIRQDAPVDLKIAIPDNVKVTGKEGFFRIQWSPNKEAVDGYEVVVSTTNNILNPDITVIRVGNPKANYADYHVGNAALTRSFAVRAFQGSPARFFSDWSPVVSTTSISTTTVGGAEPANPSTPPATNEPPPSGERLGSGGRIGIPQ